MLRKLYDWTLSFSDSRYALLALGFIAFIESSVFPIPPHVLMIPIIIASPNRAFLVATIVTLGSVSGGALGYFIGAQLFDTLGQPILEFYHKTENFEAFKIRFNAQGHWAVLIAGLTPFPYKVITITSGVTGMNFAAFMLWSLIARATIFFVIAGLLWKFGLPIRDFIEKRLGLMFTLFCILLLGGFILVKLL
ncbi:hypothetical protein GCM10007939_03120 [Amylibacter marinus]|uniref:VTT domain-containing protein n=1 Tax=Amylibacter marinus TaxID=1475483 RepID=A0ABQ5VRS4_9RHOB|nr:YqaA family protein [Amylibacter marinus]GLQ34029.1 hypothetical protein GCM10007939_03120 [Amylibacter marinus]